MCLYNLREYRNAIKAFDQAAKTPRSRRVSGQWINVINADIKRNEQIELAEEAARKTRKQLEERKSHTGRA